MNRISETDRGVTDHAFSSSAILGLCQFERLLLEDQSRGIGAEHPAHLQDCIWQFQNAVDGIARHTDELIRLGLAHHLPVSIAAYTALPLLLHLLDVKLAPNSSAGALKQRRLGVFLELMRNYEPRFLEIEFVWQLLRIVIDFLDIENPSSQQIFLQQQNPEDWKPQIYQATVDVTSSTTSNILSKSPGPVIIPSRNWREIFQSKPYQYMAMALLLDLSLAQNRVPSRDDVFVRLLNESALARMFPSPIKGPRVNNHLPREQGQLLLEEPKKADATGVEEGQIEETEETEDSSWAGLEDSDPTISPTVVSALFESIAS